MSNFEQFDGEKPPLLYSLLKKLLKKNVPVYFKVPGHVIVAVEPEPLPHTTSIAFIEVVVEEPELRDPNKKLRLRYSLHIEHLDTAWTLVKISSGFVLEPRKKLSRRY